AQNGLRTKIWDDHVLGWIQDVFPEDATGVFWTGHPNNPTARAWDRAHLLGLIDRSPNLLSVVDEAYLPFFPDEADGTPIPSSRPSPRPQRLRPAVCHQDLLVPCPADRLCRGIGRHDQSSPALPAALDDRHGRRGRGPGGARRRRVPPTHDRPDRHRVGPAH